MNSNNPRYSRPGRDHGENLHRRHLDESQRAMIASRISNSPRGGDEYANRNRHTDFGETHIKNDEAAAMMQVNKSSVSQARTLRREAIPEVIAAVESGELSLRAASIINELPKPEQGAALHIGVQI